MIFDARLLPPRAAPQACLPWQCLYFLPEPQGHSALRETRPQVDSSLGSTAPLRPRDLTGEDEFELAEAALSSGSTLRDESPARARPEPVQSRVRTGAVDPSDESTWGRASRNALCPCGSGKKSTHCHRKHP